MRPNHSYDAGCRCGECRAANAERARKARADRFSRQIPARVKHGSNSTYTNWRCRCAPCVTAHREYEAKANARRRESGTNHLRGGVNGYCSCDRCRAYQAKNAEEYRAQKQAESVNSATNHRKEWTGPELEIVARADLTSHEAAAMLGRTYVAVLNMRHRLRFDPRKVNLAGIALCPATSRRLLSGLAGSDPIFAVRVCTRMAGHDGEHYDGTRKVKWSM